MSQPEYDVACLTVQLGAIAENYRTCERLAGDAVAAGVVKADAYGLGAAWVTKALAARGCDTFFVARLEEGVALRPVAPAARIFVLDGARTETVAALKAHNLIPVLNSLDEIAAWSAKGGDAALHVDTGINRLGLPPAELTVLSAEKAKRLKGVNVVLVMSHLACGDDPGSAMNGQQRDRFTAALAALPAAPASLSSSGGIMLGREYAFDLVRPGIALYGGNPQIGRPNPFAVAARLTGHILQRRRVDKGEAVGYGATFRAEGTMTLATVALGYADGLMRALGNRGTGAIAGHRIPIVGRVSMDLITVDVTGIAEDLTVPGAEVEFLGDTVLLDDVATAAGTASYEILTSLGARAARRYTDEGAP
jgi:alanine racemase